MRVAFVRLMTTAFAIFLQKPGSVANQPVLVGGGKALLVNAAKLDRLFQVEFARRKSNKINAVFAFLFKR